jgi:hypothetical protein
LSVGSCGSRTVQTSVALSRADGGAGPNADDTCLVSVAASREGLERRARVPAIAARDRASRASAVRAPLAEPSGRQARPAPRPLSVRPGSVPTASVATSPARALASRAICPECPASALPWARARPIRMASVGGTNPRAVAKAACATARAAVPSTQPTRSASWDRATWTDSSFRPASVTGQAPVSGASRSRAALPPAWEPSACACARATINARPGRPATTGVAGSLDLGRPASGAISAPRASAPTASAVKARAMAAA